MTWLLKLLPWFRTGASVAGGFLGSPLVLVSIGVAVVSVASAGYLGYQYASGQCAKDEVRRLEILEEIRALNRELADDVANRTEASISNIRSQHTTIIRPEVRREIEIHKVLRDPDCAIPLTTVRGVLNPARGYIERGAPAGEPAPTVPAAGEAPR